MLKVGDLVEVEQPFFWYDENRYEVGQRFVIEAQHVGHNFEAFVKVVTE
ncbi:hypothetical protein [Paenibacillus sp. FSL L8-0709]